MFNQKPLEEDGCENCLYVEFAPHNPKKHKIRECDECKQKSTLPMHEFRDKRTHLIKQVLEEDENTISFTFKFDDFQTMLQFSLSMKKYK